MKKLIFLIYVVLITLLWLATTFLIEFAQMYEFRLISLGGLFLVVWAWALLYIHWKE